MAPRKATQVLKLAHLAQAGQTALNCSVVA